MLAGGFEEEPGAAFGFIDPHFDQAGRGVVVRLGGNFVSRTQAFDQGLVVGVEFEQHVARRHEFLVVVVDSLQAGDVPDGADGGAADFAHALCDVVADREDLRALFIEQQVIVAEMRTAHVPVEILRFEVKRKDIGQNRVQNAGKILHILGAEAVLNIRLCRLWIADSYE